MEKMSNSLNLALTDELKKFIQSQSGEGILFSTPSEYVRDLIHHEKLNTLAPSLEHEALTLYKRLT